MNESRCPIWGTEATVRSESDARHVVSPRAGGNFTLTGSAAATKLTRAQKVSLTSYILEANLRNITPDVTTATLRKLPSSTMPLSGQLNSVLMVVARISGLGEQFWLVGVDGFGIPPELLAAVGFDAPKGEDSGAFDPAAHLVELLKAGARRGWIDFDRSSAPILTYEGRLHVEALGATASESPRIFVAMWFGSDETNNLYVNAIEPAIRAAGYVPVRIDNKEHNEKIDDEIIAEIRRAKTVVVDMTCGLARPEGWGGSGTVGAPRGGVYFEAGFAKGLGLPVIWTVKAHQADIENVVHFDIRQYAQLRWSDDLEDFKEKLRNRIEATLGRGYSQPA